VKTSILLVNYGGPRSPAEIPIFLTNLLGRTVPVELIEAVSERYRTIGGFSPLPEICERQATTLKAAFPDCDVKAFFRYTGPMIEEGINEARLSGTERLILLIMTPFYNTRTVEGYIAAANSYLSMIFFDPARQFLHSWYAEPLFAECWAEKIKEEAPKGDVFYLFSAHSLPLRDAEPYRSQILESMESIARRCSLASYGLGWQSAPPTMNEPWLEPKVESLLDQAVGKHSTIVQVPLGFVSDHLETLYDMDRLHRAYAVQKGLKYQRISSLNTHPLFMGLLTQILKRAVQ
jgi:protoporphyrin/coproporphyrin ferrochelatase